MENCQPTTQHGELVQATKERQSKAWFRRSEEQREMDRLWVLIRLGSVVSRATPTGPTEPHEEGPHPASVVPDPLAVPEAIQ